MSRFVQLHCHSESSFLDGFAKVDHIALRAKELGQEAASITDHGEVNGHLAFQKACRKAGVKPVFGMEGYWSASLDSSRENKTKGKDTSHITLLAKNQRGLENLWAWSSKAYTPQYFYQKPQADLAMMREYSDGLYASDGCFRGDQRFLTAYGTKTFVDTVGTTQKVLGRRAEWVSADIRSFGVQEIYRLVVARYGVEKEIFTTANHRWLTGRYRTSGGNLAYTGRKEKLTVDLTSGDVLQTVFAKKYTDRVFISPIGVQAGIVFGDGTTVTSKMGRREAKVVLYGDKDASLLKWFPLNPTTTSHQAGHSVAQIEVRGLPGYFKDGPDLCDCSLGYLYGWLAGYFAADGCMTTSGSAVLHSTTLSNLQLAQDVCHLLGIRTGRITQCARVVTPPKGTSRTSTLYRLSLNVRDLKGEFFLLDEHRRRFWDAHDRKEQTWADWKVVSVEATGQMEEVFCAIVPDGNAFVLEDNILTGNCLLTEFARAVEVDDESRAREILASLLGVFGDSFFVELHTWQIIDPQDDKARDLNRQMTKLNGEKVRLAQELSIPLVVVNDAHYAWEKDWENHALVWEFNTRNSDQTGKGKAAAWMMDDEEVVQWMLRHGIRRSITEEAIVNTARIAEDCNAEISPTLDIPRLTASERDDIAMFLDLLEKGYKRKVIDAGLDPEVYGQRMESEAEFIVDRSFAGYFNIVADYVKAAKTGVWRQYVTPGSDKDPLLVGPGRGSAGGSLVAYLLDITTIDPLKYDLLFSRFISPGRKGLPDIDVDVPQSKRPEMRNYFAARYGEDHVCGIGTRNRSQARGTLADLCRVFAIPFSDRLAMSDILDEVADIDNDTPDSWDQILEEKGGDLAPWVQKHPGLFTKMGEMVGLARHSGTHAAGVLISAKPILGNLPTRVKSGVTVTQFDMHEVEELGGVKLDLLGLRHLDTLATARQLIYDRHGVFLDYYSFGDDKLRDPAIWPQIDRGETTGIFQLETPSGTKVAVEYKPRSELDVADVSAINRPGVIRAGLLKHYLWRRQGLEEVSYDHPLMQDIVGSTYGILVYQEQLIEAVQKLAGFTPQEADDLRKLVGKKEIDRLGPMKDKFIVGCLGNLDFVRPWHGEPWASLDAATEKKCRGVAEKIWMSFEASGSYAFNKSHAVEYATISTWEIWTKHYYPTEFIVALMRTDPHNINKYVREARKRAIRILPPDINTSDTRFTLEGNDIRYGLDSVFGVGQSATKDILVNRPFKSLDDFLNRTRSTGANKKQVVTNLISIGAFDSFGDRANLIGKYHDWRILHGMSANKVAKLSYEQQVEEIAAWREKHKNDENYDEKFFIPDFSDENIVYEIERVLVGNYVTVDPMSKYVKTIEEVAISHPSEIKDITIGSFFLIGGQVVKVRETKTKRGKDMAFLRVSWNEEEFGITAFPEAWQDCRSLLEKDAPVICRVIRDEYGCHLSGVLRLDYVLEGK